MWSWLSLFRGLQQDGHRDSLYSSTTRSWRNPSCGSRPKDVFRAKAVWPPSSPDKNAIAFTFWGTQWGRQSGPRSEIGIQLNRVKLTGGLHLRPSARKRLQHVMDAGVSHIEHRRKCCAFISYLLSFLLSFIVFLCNSRLCVKSSRYWYLSMNEKLLLHCNRSIFISGSWSAEEWDDCTAILPSTFMGSVSKKSKYPRVAKQEILDRYCQLNLFFMF